MDKPRPSWWAAASTAGGTGLQSGGTKGVGRVPALVPGGGETGKDRWRGPVRAAGAPVAVGGRGLHPRRASEQGRGRCQLGCRERAWAGAHCCGAIRGRSRAAPLPPPPEAAWRPPRSQRTLPGDQAGRAGERAGRGGRPDLGSGRGWVSPQLRQVGAAVCRETRVASPGAGRTGGGGLVHRRPPSPHSRTRMLARGPSTRGAGASHLSLAGSAPA